MECRIKTHSYSYNEPTGIDDVLEKDKIIFFPNPVFDVVNQNVIPEKVEIIPLAFIKHTDISLSFGERL